MKRSIITLLALAACTIGSLSARPETSKYNSPKDHQALYESFVKVLKENLQPHRVKTDEASKTATLTLKIAGKDVDNNIVRRLYDRYYRGYQYVHAEEFGLPSDFASIVTVALSLKDVLKFSSHTRLNLTDERLVRKILDDFIEASSEEICNAGNHTAVTLGDKNALCYNSFKESLKGIEEAHEAASLFFGLLLLAKAFAS
jgi:hypothetical protein